MKHPLGKIDPHLRPALFVTLLVLTLVTMLGLNLQGAPLRTEPAPSGILAFEFAGDVKTAQGILDSWGDRTKISAGFNLGLDYLFLTLYSTTIALGTLWVGERLWPDSRIPTAITMLAWGQWLAAILDMVENAALLKILLDGPAHPWPQVARWCALPKFGLVLMGIAFVLLGAFFLRLRSGHAR